MACDKKIKKSGFLTVGNIYFFFKNSFEMLLCFTEQMPEMIGHNINVLMTVLAVSNHI